MNTVHSPHTPIYAYIRWILSTVHILPSMPISDEYSPQSTYSHLCLYQMNTVHSPHTPIYAYIRWIQSTVHILPSMPISDEYSPQSTYSHLCLWIPSNRDYPAFCRLTLLTTHNKIIRAPAGFESASPASDRPQTLALDRSATDIGKDSIPGPSSP